MKTIKKIIQLILLCLLGAGQNLNAQSNSMEDVALKYSKIFSSFSSKDTDGLGKLVVFAQFDQEVPVKDQATVLAKMMSDDPQKDSFKDAVIIEYLCQKDHKNLPWSSDLEKKISLKKDSANADVRSRFLNFMSKFKPDDHETIASFLKDSDDLIRTRTVDIVGDWPEGMGILKKYYELNKLNPDYVKSIERAKARLNI